MDKGRMILYKTFWNSEGYCYKEPTPEEFSLAVAEGYMFEDTDPLSHKDTLIALREVVEKVSPLDVANAFLYSLSTRELAYRSPMGSYWYAKAIPPHASVSPGWCIYCGWRDGYHDYRVQRTRYGVRSMWSKHTLENSCNFHRHKFGGRHHNEAQYALFDLQQFILMPKVTPTETDRAMFRAILNTIAELEPARKAGAYRTLLLKKKIIPGNRIEISSLIDMLGLCGVLSTAEHPCPDVEFRGRLGIDPPELRSDIAYPVCWWRARDGVNEARFQEVFGFPHRDL